MCSPILNMYDICRHARTHHPVHRATLLRLSVDDVDGEAGRRAGTGARVQAPARMRGGIHTRFVTQADMVLEAAKMAKGPGGRRI